MPEEHIRTYEMGNPSKIGDPSLRELRLRSLEKEYGEVCSNFRTLTDIRFRLLALLPIIAAAAAAFKLEALAPMGRIPLALFGLVATIGLVTYSKRNDQLYNQLVGRAASIERSIALQDGYFAHRPNSWLRFNFGPVGWDVSHGRGVGTIYFATIAFWLFMEFEAIVSYMGSTPLAAFDLWPNWHPYFGGAARLVALLAAVMLTSAAAFLLKCQERARDTQIRRGACIAMKKLLRAELKIVSHDGGSEDAAILAALKGDRAFKRQCACILGDRRKDQLTVSARILFYSGLTAGVLRHYVPESSGIIRAAFLLALLVDLPPQWLADNLSNRTGRAPARQSRRVSLVRRVVRRVVRLCRGSHSPVTIGEASL
jgi:hypothetical protein